MKLSRWPCRDRRKVLDGMPRPSSKCQQEGSCATGCTDALQPDGMSGTDWLSELLDSDLDSLQVSVQYAPLLVNPSGTHFVTCFLRRAADALAVLRSLTLGSCPPTSSSTASSRGGL